MKPIKLTMRGFMTYKDQIEIDFTKLYPKKIFLVSGDTGSGKTTIFDGISYALYGEISRGISGSTLRSDFLSETDPYTFVRLEFELDGKRYMVERIPSQEANKEGKSINLRGNSASFYEIGNEKESLLTKVTPVNNKIIELMGLDKDQFTKVMLLAQGQFQQFLSADSKVRSKLLGDIFKTLMYEEIQIDLKERAKASANKLEAIYESLKTEVERDEELAANVEIGDIASRKFKPILEQINLIITDRENLYADIESNKNKLNEEYTNLIRKKEQILNDNANIEKLNTIKHDLESLSEAENQYENLKENLKKAELAYGIKDFENRLDGLKNNLDNKEKSLFKSQNDLELVNKSLSEHQDLVDSLPDKNKTLDKFKTEKIKLLETQNNLLEYNEKKRDYLAIEDKLIKLEDLKRSQDNDKINLAKSYEDLDQKNTLLDSKKTDLRLREIEHRSLNEDANQIADEIAIYNKNQEILSQIATNGDNILALQGQRADTLKIKNLFEENQMLIQINSLIDDLNKSGICPVCKTHHDDIFEKHAISDIESIDLSEEEIAERLSTIDIKIAQLNERNTSLEATVREVADIDELEIKLKELDKNIADINKEITELSDVQKEISNEILSIRANIDKLSKAISTADNEITNLNHLASESQSLKTYYDANKETMEALDENEIKEDISDISTNIVGLEGEINQINSTYNQLKIIEEKFKSEISNYQVDIKSLREDIAKYELELKNKITAAFVSENEYREILATYDEIITRKGEIEDFFERINNLRISRDTLKEYEDMEIIDVAAINTNIDALESEIEEVNKNLSDIHHRLLNIRGIRVSISNLRDDYNTIESNSHILHQLSEIANGDTGKVAGRTKVKFETFVLTYYFDKVLNLANMRLAYMSNGQFKMVRSRTAMDNRKDAGLDIEILDANTGKLRPASTLSGGESFLASLALALGLSDEISAESGGITIDTLFIDEGFGTLSDDYLNKVIEQIEILSYENKFIGLISHVKELKDAIDAKILVDYDEATGSSIKIIS